MSTIRLEVCTCCAISEKPIADAVARIRAEHGSQIEIVERKCLDVCAEHGATKLGDEVIVVRPGEEGLLEERVRRHAALAR